MLDNAQLMDVVHDAIQEYNEQAPADQQVDISTDAKLIGRDGALDSLGVVNLVVTVEQAMADATGKELSLVSERAMSRESSPFRTIGSLIEYVCELVHEG